MANNIIKVQVAVPDDLATLRSREWFRSEFQAVCHAHIDDVRAMLTGPKRRRRKPSAAATVPALLAR